ncbi:AvaB protein [Kalaharituber pfeilii]|nr:AvaB protein [Kalaharituber pfeilii]
MLNAFHATSIFELGPRERVKIESLLAYSDKLILGLNNGNLRVFHVKSPDTSEISLSHVRTVEKFSRKPIDALACIKEVSILVSLSGGVISLHDLESFTLQQTLTKTVGALVFAVTTNIEKDEETGIPSMVCRLAVGGKKRLLLYAWYDGEFQDAREVILSGNARTMTWANSRKLVVGLGTGGFVMVDIHTGVTSDIVPPQTNVAGEDGKPAAETEAAQWGWGMGMGMGGWGMGGWGSKPLSTRLKGEELLLVKDKTTLFVNAEGKAVPDKASIPWPHAPDAIAYSYPYLVSVHQSMHHLEVRNPATQTLVQTINLPNVTALHVPPPKVALVHAGKLFYVYSPTQVWRMNSTEYEEQVQELIANDNLDEAISVLEQLESALLESKEERIREVQMLKAKSLFDKRRYRESMDLFTDVEAPPERVIPLFPKIIAGDLSTVVEDKEDETASDQEGSMPAVSETPERGGAETNGGASAEPEPAATGEASNAGEAEPHAPSEEADSNAHQGKKVTNGNGHGHGLDIAPVIASLRKVVADDASSIRSKKLAEDDVPSAKGSIRERKHKPKQAPSILDERELKKAVNELTHYLGDSRRLLAKYIDKLETERSNVSLGSTDHGSPLRAPFGESYFGRNASVDSNIDKLEKAYETAKLVHTTLFRAYMFAKPSLVESLVRRPNHCDPDVVNEKLKETGRFNDLVYFFGGKKLHRQALALLKQFGEAKEPDPRSPNLHGPARTVEYLKTLDSSNLGLIFEFAEWPLRANPTVGMDIFLNDSENAASLPRGTVLDYLESIDRLLAIRYLEHLIDTVRDMTPEFHSRLAGQYLEHIRQTNWVEKNGGDEEAGQKEKEEWKERMLDFLRDSKQYRSEKVLAWLPREDPDFYEARAIILSSMGQHKAALEIYVFKLQSPIKAEDYCVRIHTLLPPAHDPAETPSGTTVFHILLSLYLRPPPPYPPEPQLDNALAILSRHGARLEPSEALKLVPEDLQIAKLESYFKGRIRHANSRVLEGKIRAQLSKGDMWAKQERAIDLKARKVVIGEARVCPVCHKRLGRSVVSVFPDGVVVHYGCGVKEKESPVAKVIGERWRGVPRGREGDGGGSEIGGRGVLY